ncbi:MAG: hypothetical protein BWY72_01585 [Bacteroidetes bacterium ADurb.Bin416]|nr:MAG: hypothetical protein BWY72_01585 [Bacteroidetes bacterium ADurb.Bin416]
MVILFVPHHVDHLVDGVFSEAEGGCSDVLSHVHRGSVGSEQYFLIQPVCREIGPNRPIFLAQEQALFQSFQHFVLAWQVGFRFVVDFVESHSQLAIGFIESSINPFIHGSPELSDFGIAGFPPQEHVASLGHQRGGSFGGFLAVALIHQRGNLLLVMLVERHVEIAHQVVAFFTGGGRCFSLTPFLPG